MAKPSQSRCPARIRTAGCGDPTWCRQTKRDLASACRRVLTTARFAPRGLLGRSWLSTAEQAGDGFTPGLRFSLNVVEHATSLCRQFRIGLASLDVVEDGLPELVSDRAVLQLRNE